MVVGFGLFPQVLGRCGLFAGKVQLRMGRKGLKIFKQLPNFQNATAFGA